MLFSGTEGRTKSGALGGHHFGIFDAVSLHDNVENGLPHEVEGHGLVDEHEHNVQSVLLHAVLKGKLEVTGDYCKHGVGDVRDVHSEDDEAVCESAHCLNLPGMSFELDASTHVVELNALDEDDEDDELQDDANDRRNCDEFEHPKEVLPEEFNI